jgi:hypothetical protein
MPYADRERQLAYWRDRYAARREEVADQKRRLRLEPDYVPRNRSVRDRARRVAMKLRMLDHYGQECACCGEAEVAFLTLDHIEGNGRAHRCEALGHESLGGSYFYRWLEKQGWPGGYQVLCWNCNSAKHFLGECPHQTARRKEEAV